MRKVAGPPPSLAYRLLNSIPAVTKESEEERLQYTIEARELTSEYTHRPPYDVQSRSTIIEASDADEAISRFVRDSECELVSFTKPAAGSESIATVKKQDTVFLVRVYAA